MKDGLENIDEVFKQAFDGFEANVDPSVWSNIQSSISSGSGGNSTPQVDPSAATGVVGKSLALKIVAGVALVTTVATSVYFIPGLFENEETVITENIITDNNSTELINEVAFTVAEELNTALTENNVVLVDEVEGSVESNELDDDTKSVIVVDNTNSSITDDSKASDATDVPNDNTSNQTSAKKPSVKKSTTKPNPIKEDDSAKILVKIKVDVNKGSAPLTVQFDAIGDEDVTYFWDFGDGIENFTGDAPVHTFLNEGTYRVELKGLNKHGETKSAHVDITVEKDFSSSLHELPTIFTPNGDGLNDIIKIEGNNIEKIQVHIFDSKGKSVYFMDSLDDTWEGKDQNGNYLISGQYYMSVVAMGRDGKKHMKKSAINLRK